MKFVLGVGIVTLFWMAALSAGTRELPPSAVLVQPEHWHEPAGRTDADAARVLQFVARDDSASAILMLRSWSDPLRFEPAAARVIETLQAQPSTRAGDALLAALEREPVRLFRRHEETAADWFLPLFDIPGRAASARRLLAFADERDALIARLQNDPRATLKSGKIPAQALTAAVERLPSEVIVRVATLALAGDVVLPSPAWAALARRRPEAAVLQATLQRAEPLDVLPLLEELPSKLAAPLAFDWLEQASRLADYASSAVLGLGALAPRSPAAEAALVKHLGNPVTGTSAAAALSRLALPDRLERIDALLTKARTPEVLADLALALRLEGSAAALNRLHALEADPRLPATAKAELQR